MITIDINGKPEDIKLCQIFTKYILYGVEQTALEMNMKPTDVLEAIELVRARLESMILADENRLN
jgi:hypothetical protein